MKTLSRNEIKAEANKVYDLLIARYALKNAKKIVFLVRKRFLETKT